MSWRPAVSLADLVRAVRTLDVRTEEDVAAVACMLGLAPAAPVDAGIRADEPRDIATATVGPPRLAPVTREAPRPMSTVDLLPAVHVPDRPAPAAEVERLPPASVIGRAPREVPDLETMLATPGTPALPLEHSLFVSRWQRGILSALAGTKRPTGAVDVERVVREIASGRGLTRLPRVGVHTLRAGLQVLVDIGEGMRPFTEDVAELERALRQTVGADGLEILRFERAIANGVGPGTRRTWGPYRPPGPAAPVLVVSDFDLAGAADEIHGALTWKGLAETARTGAHPLIALTPFPPARWPDWLRRIFTVVPWDRATNAATARRAAQAAAQKGA